MPCNITLCLVSHKYEHMQKKLDDLQEESKKVGFQINPLKTEEIRVNTIINRVFKLKREEIKSHQIFVIWAVWWLKMVEPGQMLM